MKRLNLLKEFPHYYSSKEAPEVINIAAAKFVSITAQGSFIDRIYYDRIEALKLTVNAIKESYENSPQAFDIPPMEALYWYDKKKYGTISISKLFDSHPLREIHYRLMFRVPEYVTAQDIIKVKKTVSWPYQELASDAEMFEYNEGRCIQMYHLGPFIYEGDTLRKLESYVNKNHLVKNGLHHEIYLIDFTKVKSQEGLRTILREPVKQKGIL